MSSEISVRAATLEDLARLHAYNASRGQLASRTLERHLARPRYRPAFTRIAERAGELAGCLLIGHERLALGTAVLEVGRIEALDVLHGQGYQGIFEALLGDCLRALMDEGLPLAVLYGPPELYTPFGFAPYQFDMAVLLPSGERGPEHALALRPAAEVDLEDLAALYESSCRRLPLAEIRALPDWRFWLAQGGTALALDDERGRLVGYAALEQPVAPGTLVAAEAAAADAGAARALCVALQRHALAHGLERIKLALSPWHIVSQAALHLGGESRITAVPDRARAAMIAGVVDLPMLLEALAPEFERRLARSRYAGWSGNLRIEIETERITLALAAGHATVIDGSRPADLRLRQVTLPALAQLLLGYRAAADLRATRDLACDDSALGLINGLFPVVLAAGREDEY
jgi:predicted N-acetyltransferase YhbS